MTREVSGLLSELALVRMHGRAQAYIAADPEERAAIVAACRREASVPDLVERILSRTIYAQASSRVGPLRELLQNALDASARGARIDVRSGAPEPPQVFEAVRREREITVSDQGRGMRRDEILEDLLVPFRSGKENDPDAIGEHGVGFLSALEIAPRIEITTKADGEAHRLRLEPASARAPYADFLWTLTPLDPGALPGTGTVVRLKLEQPIDRLTLLAEIAAAAGLVDPGRARIYVNDARINTARLRMRKVACAPIGPGGARGEIELFIGRGEGIPPRLLITQRGLLVAAPQDPLHRLPRGRALSRSLHGDLIHAITAAGYGFVADLPRAAPLNKGRSAVAGIAAGEVEEALTEAFERFILEDALYNRELLRGVDHRLSSVLDRLVITALADERAQISLPASSPGGQRPGAPGSGPALDGEAIDGAEGPISTSSDAPLLPTVAPPEEVLRFADALLDAPMFAALTFERVAARDGAGAALEEVRSSVTLRAAFQAYREGRLRSAGEGRVPGVLYLSTSDPLSQALFRRLSMIGVAPASAGAARPSASVTLPCVCRQELLTTAAAVPGVRALAAAITVIERIDAAVSAAAGLLPSRISVHQDLYGPDEMAHTDGTGISLNLSSPRIRALLTAALGSEDPVAVGALVDLVLHEKSHVSLASNIPRAAAEHGASFYRRKDLLRRSLLQALATGAVADPAAALASARRGLSSAALPSPEALAFAFQTPASIAA